MYSFLSDNLHYLPVYYKIKSLLYIYILYGVLQSSLTRNQKCVREQHLFPVKSDIKPMSEEV